MAYLQLAHLRGAFSPGRPYRPQKGFEQVTSVLLTAGGGPDIVYSQIENTFGGFDRTFHANYDYVISSHPLNPFDSSVIDQCHSRWQFVFVHRSCRFVAHFRTAHSLSLYPLREVYIYLFSG